MVVLANSQPVTTGDLILPLFVEPRYSYNIDLEDQSYTFSIHWNEYDVAWYLDILGVSNGIDFPGIKMVVGQNLIKPYAILELGALYIIDGEAEGLDPDYDNIGTRYMLYYVPTTNPDAII